VNGYPLQGISQIEMRVDVCLMHVLMGLWIERRCFASVSTCKIAIFWAMGLAYIFLSRGLVFIIPRNKT